MKHIIIANSMNPSSASQNRHKIVKKVLTGSRIDECFVLYSILRGLYEERFGMFNPNFAKEELNKI